MIRLSFIVTMISIPMIVLCSSASATSHGETVDAQPPDPVWPNKFQQKFREKLYYPAVGTHYTQGTYYYDFVNKRYRVDRTNGRYDRYCGFNGIKFFQNTPCSHLVLEGIRWMIYPEKKECCQCCDAAHGCGVLKPTWLKGAKFIGAYNGTYKWNQPGLQANYYTERIKDRVMLEINQVPNDIQYFYPETFQTTIKNETEVFHLPDYCVKGKKCAFFSTCRAVGK